MPLTAQHASAGVLDATVDPLGEGMPWEAIHRARPRAPLTCRECGHGLHAKVSPKGLRFFAHDRAAPTCSLVGETMAHRLLKLQLASAIRDAGWYAELEVAGDGWRADVLATSPDGAPGPCPGHGWWRPVEPGVGLSVFVAGVLVGTIRAHRALRYSRLFLESARIVWTTRPHVIAERAQLVASEHRREHDDLASAEHERHLAAIPAKLARQQALTPPAVELVGRESRGYVGVRDATPEWAMGVPLFVYDTPQGVISPVVSRISAEVRARLGGLTLFVATEAERRALARACGPEQRIVLFEVEIPDQPQPPAAIYSGTFWSRRQWATGASRRTRR